MSDRLKDRLEDWLEVALGTVVMAPVLAVVVLGLNAIGPDVRDLAVSLVPELPTMIIVEYR